MIKKRTKLDRPIEYSKIDDLPKIQKVRAQRLKTDEAANTYFDAKERVFNQAFEKRDNIYDSGRTVVDATINSPFAEKNKKAYHKAVDEMREVAQENNFTKEFNSDTYFREAHYLDELDEVAPKIPSEYLPKISKRGLTLLGKSIPIIGAGLSAYAALQADDVGAAVMDAIVPGGVESMGVNEEQKILDKRYKQKIQERRDLLNQM
jgi:hypothetical protein